MPLASSSPGMCVGLTAPAQLCNPARVLNAVQVAAAAAEDEALARDREAYITALQQRHQAAAARLEAKRRKQLGLVNPAEAAAAALASRGRRTGAEQR